MTSAVTVGYRLGVASRSVAAALGAYAAAALFAILLAVTLPLDPIDRAVIGTLSGIVVLPFIAIACFRVRSAARAWAVVLGLSLLSAASALAAGWRP